MKLLGKFLQGDFINFITTSRKPSINTRVFVKEFSSLVDASYITRGKSSISDLVSASRYNGVQKLYVVTDNQGNPNQLIEISIDHKNWEFSNVFRIKCFKLRKNIDSENYRIKDLNYTFEKGALRKLLRSAGVYPNEESLFEIKENNEIYSVYYKGKDIGPVFSLEYMQKSDFDANKSNP